MVAGGLGPFDNVRLMLANSKLLAIKDVTMCPGGKREFPIFFTVAMVV